MDEVERTMRRASALADERGYRDKPQSELLVLAEQLCEEHYKAAKLGRQIGWRLQAENVAGRKSNTIDRGESAGPKQDQKWLEYMAVVDAFSKETREVHHEAMVAKFGGGFLVGT